VATDPAAVARFRVDPKFKGEAAGDVRGFRVEPAALMREEAGEGRGDFLSGGSAAFAPKAGGRVMGARGASSKKICLHS